MIKIETIKIERLPDYDCDLSWIGKFGNKIPDGKFGVKHYGNRNSYPYFISRNAENKKQAQQDYERIMEFENGNVYVFGIKAVAELRTSDNGKEWLINHISSGGLWGIESDSDEKYVCEIEDDQITELRSVLKQLGASDKTLNEVIIQRV